MGRSALRRAECGRQESGLVHEPGTRVLPICVGEVPVTLRFGDSSLAAAARARYLPFASKSGAEFPLLVNPSAAREIAAPLESPQFEFALNGALLRVYSSSAVCERVNNEYTLDSLLRVLFSCRLPALDGFLIHAATVARGERTFVFTGRSGAGKSTIASHAPAGAALTDEISLVRRVAGNWQACGTPFWGEFRAAGQQRRAPLAGIYSLVQAPRNSVVRLNPREAVRALLPNVLFFSKAAAHREALLRVATELAATLPVYRLEFSRDISFWQEIAA